MSCTSERQRGLCGQPLGAGVKVHTRAGWIEQPAVDVKPYAVQLLHDSTESLESSHDPVVDANARHALERLGEPLGASRDQCFVDTGGAVTRDADP
jgi:hypothetical protein